MPLYLLMTLLSSLVFTTWLARHHLLVVTVSGYSMDPTLVDGDRVLVVRGWPAWLRRRGRIVVLEPWAELATNAPPVPPGTLFIKRVIGLPGDTVVTTLAELHADLQLELRAAHDAAGRRTWYIPTDHLFVRGDYPRRGADSLGWGPVATARVRGWVLLQLGQRAAIAPHPVAPLVRRESLLSGQPAPPFTAQTLTGVPISLHTYAGRPIILLFVTHAAPLRQVITDYAALQDRAAQAGVALLLVCTNDADITHAWAAELPPRLPILVAPRSTNPFVRDYKINGMPRYCLIDSAGIVQATGYPSQEWGSWQALVDSWA